MDGRMERAKVRISSLPNNKLQSTLSSELKGMHDEIQRAWQSVIEQLADTPTHSASPTWARFNEDVQEHAERIDVPWHSPARREQARRQHQDSEMPVAYRLMKELADVEFRIAQGLDRCDQFFDDQSLLYCRHSRSKSLLLGYNFKAPLDFYSRALKGNNDIIRITVTTFANPMTNHWLVLASRDTYVFMQTTDSLTIAVSFVGPSSGSLLLRLKHRAHQPGITLAVLDRSFTLAIPESFTVDDINLHPIGESTSQLSFMPNARKNLILHTSDLGYEPQDLQLLDEDGNPYGQPSRRNVPAIEFDAPHTPKRS
jgi:hypothetical protein